jgi:hypothetical protein
LDGYKFLNPYSEQFEYVVVTVRLLNGASQSDAAPLVVGSMVNEQPGYDEVNFDLIFIDKFKKLSINNSTFVAYSRSNSTKCAVDTFGTSTSSSKLVYL